jgi:hypothetical protein
MREPRGAVGVSQRVDGMEAAQAGERADLEPPRRARGRNDHINIPHMGPKCSQLYSNVIKRHEGVIGRSIFRLAARRRHGSGIQTAKIRHRDADDRLAPSARPSRSCGGGWSLR